MAICIPLVCGFPTKIKQEAPSGPQNPPRMCPRCNNAAVIACSSRTYFEFCFVPLIPFGKHRLWKCGICQWEMDQGSGPDPQPPGAHGWGMQGGGGGGGGYHMNPPPPQFGK